MSCSLCHPGPLGKVSRPCLLLLGLTQPLSIPAAGRWLSCALSLVVPAPGDPRAPLTLPVSPAEGEVNAEEEGFENLWTTASTFIVLFLLSLFYSTTVTLFKVHGSGGGGGEERAGARAGQPSRPPGSSLSPPSLPPGWLFMLPLLPAGEVTQLWQDTGARDPDCRARPGPERCGPCDPRLEPTSSRVPPAVRSGTQASLHTSPISPTGLLWPQCWAPILCSAVYMHVVLQ